MICSKLSLFFGGCWRYNGFNKLVCKWKQLEGNFGEKLGKKLCPDKKFKKIGCLRGGQTKKL